MSAVEEKVTTKNDWSLFWQLLERLCNQPLRHRKRSSISKSQEISRNFVVVSFSKRLLGLKICKIARASILNANRYLLCILKFMLHSCQLDQSSNQHLAGILDASLCVQSVLFLLFFMGSLLSPPAIIRYRPQFVMGSITSPLAATTAAVQRCLSTLTWRIKTNITWFAWYLIILYNYDNWLVSKVLPSKKIKKRQCWNPWEWCPNWKIIKWDITVCWRVIQFRSPFLKVHALSDPIQTLKSMQQRPESDNSCSTAKEQKQPKDLWTLSSWNFASDKWQHAKWTSLSVSSCFCVRTQFWGI